MVWSINSLSAWSTKHIFAVKSGTMGNKASSFYVENCLNHLHNQLNLQRSSAQSTTANVAAYTDVNFGKPRTPNKQFVGKIAGDNKSPEL